MRGAKPFNLVATFMVVAAACLKVRYMSQMPLCLQDQQRFAKFERRVSLFVFVRGSAASYSDGDY